MPELPDNYTQFSVMIAVPNDMPVMEFSRIFHATSFNLLAWGDGTVADAPTVTALRTHEGVLVGAITKLK